MLCRYRSVRSHLKNETELQLFLLDFSHRVTASRHNSVILCRLFYLLSHRPTVQPQLSSPAWILFKHFSVSAFVRVTPVIPKHFAIFLLVSSIFPCCFLRPTSSLKRRLRSLSIAVAATVHSLFTIHARYGRACAHRPPLATISTHS